MEKRELTCIGCPMGCQITVEMDGTDILSVEGYTCKRGEKYARREVIAPTRVLTTTLPVIGGISPTVSVKSAGEVPKEMLMDCVRLLALCVSAAPIQAGDVLYRNIMGTGIDIIATASVASK